MCGICGILYFNPERTVNSPVLEAMCRTLTHRGPDDWGQEIRGRAGLAMRRLSIIDLESGHQPLSNEDSTLTIVFNGEIYNYRELRKELAEKGHRFQTATDTEVILHGYETWGEGVCERLNGMFGFAIWDHREQSLFLARDRLGIKPLYVYTDEEKLLFGSEIKAILKHPDVKREIDSLALNNYLTFEYIPAPRSIFRAVRKLKPGHWLRWHEGNVKQAAYWSLKPESGSWSEEEARERLHELVTDSVRMRLISDVPLGAFLSGGIDSSILVARMAALTDRPVKTFSIGFKESSYNELKYARAVAEKYQTDHYEFMVEARALELTEKLAFHLDEPFGDFSIFPTFLVSEMAREHVTVALSGDGGDELFGGYDAYRAHLFDRRFYHRLPKLLKHRFIEPFADCLPPTAQKKGLINSFKRFIEGTTLPKSLLHARWMIFLHEAERTQLFTDRVIEEISAVSPYDFIETYAAETAGLPEITRTGYVDVKSYLVDNILVKVDRMSMATSLEARVPYLDHRIVEFAFTLPPQMKISGHNTKAVMKATFWNELPEAVQNRGKQGFSIPIKNWIRGELKPMLLDLLDSGRLSRQGLFNPQFAGQLISEHLDGRANHSHKLWALMMFQQWYDLYAK